MSWDINKNGGIGKYRAIVAEAAAWKRAKRPKPAKLAINIPLKSLVIEKLQLKWSPEQISGWLKIEFPFLKNMQISPETIYKSLYIRSRELLDIALMNSLRRAHKIRQSKRHSRRDDRGSISIVNGIFLHKRPSEIDERSISGHWDSDLISGSGNTHSDTSNLLLQAPDL
ncbi:IS30 family transposase [Paenochrobactrum glaciei]|uniref:IS30 family transposase n=1 Tax=Paenochrobactrum glaciei TaxID=486407 RepID=UPI003CD0A21C